MRQKVISFNNNMIQYKTILTNECVYTAILVNVLYLLYSEKKF